MHIKYFTSLIVTFFIWLPAIVSAGTLTGKITDDKGEVLPYATVYVQGTTIGTSANDKGIYQLPLSPGTYKVVCQYISFRQNTFSITIKGEETVQHNFSMQYQSLDMKEVVVHASGEDPAYPIIRKAIARRKYHLDQVESFQSSIYLKGVYKTRHVPTELFGQKITPKDLGIDSSGKDIFYLCEELADYYSEKPDKSKTVIHSVKESGNPNGYGFSRLPAVITFYKNNIPIFSPRGFISPISDNAIFYYKYKLQGQFQEGSHTVYKIKVTGKRLYEPVFNGTIYIVDADWAIHSLDLSVNKKSALEVLDTLTIRQLFLPLAKDTWVIKNQQILLDFNIMGFDIAGGFITVYDKQKINEPVPDTVFKEKIISAYDKNANKKDSSYWANTRLIPLESDESKDFKTKDSTIKKVADPKYQDSIRRRGNKFGTFGFLVLGGYTYKTRSDAFAINPLLLSLGDNNILNYNIVEGFNVAPKLYWTHHLDSGNYLRGALALRYGFSNTHFNSIARFSYNNNDRYWRGKSWSVGVQGGKYVFQYDADNPVWPIFNSGAALLFHQNDLKIYERWDGTVFFKRNFGNGWKLNFSGSYQQRLPLENTTTYSLVSGPIEGFSPNLPARLAGLTPWEKHDAVIADASVSYQPGYTYTQYPDYKVINASRWPVFTASYTKGVPGILNSKVDFDKWRFDISRNHIRMNLLGTFSFNVAAGGFLNANYVAIPDLMHLYGNRGIGYASPYLYSFQFAQFYDFSNKEPIYGEAHLEYHLDGLLSNKIPLLRQARWYLLAGTNTFYATRQDYYTEAFIGLDNIGWKFLRILRVDFVQSWDSHGGRNSGIRFGLSGNGLLSFNVSSANTEHDEYGW